jgi:hypothetical protein
MVDRNEMDARVRAGLQAKEAKRLLGDYIDRTRQDIFRAWSREGDPEKREAAWHLVRGFDLVEKKISDDVATGEQAAAELAYLAGKGSDQ